MFIKAAPVNILMFTLVQITMCSVKGVGSSDSSE